MSIQHVIFDLDGTLIDSADGILMSLERAFNVHGIVPRVALKRAIIGPPLMDTLALLAGTRESVILQPLAEEFKRSYDLSGYRETLVFPGVEEMLSELGALGSTLYIATNKRILPTRLIVEHLGWRKHFQGVYALDSFDPTARSKTEMIGQILLFNSIDPKNAICIGDRDEDGRAADANAISFLLAKWGYEGNSTHCWRELETPGNVLEQASRS